jgi:hypothetical protein
MEQVPEQPIREPKPEPKLEDIGTREEHLRDYLESLDACFQIMRKRGVYSKDDKERLIKFYTAAEVLKATLDSMYGLTDRDLEYSVYRVVNSVPKDPASIEGGRGTPLANT